MGTLHRRKVFRQSSDVGRLRLHRFRLTLADHPTIHREEPTNDIRPPHRDSPRAPGSAAPAKPFCLHLRLPLGRGDQQHRRFLAPLNSNRCSRCPLATILRACDRACRSPKTLPVLTCRAHDGSRAVALRCACTLAITETRTRWGCRIGLQINTVLLLLRRKLSYSNLVEVPFLVSWVALRNIWSPPILY